MANRYRRELLGSAVGAFLTSIAMTDAEPASLPVTAGRAFSVSAVDFGAVGDGIAPDGQAIQKAIDSVGAVGGGLVTLPAGIYRLERQLVLDKDVALIGCYQGPTSHTQAEADVQSKQLRGTVLTTDLSAGDEDATPLITVGNNCTLAGVAVYYPGQNPAGLPTPYPWTIDMTGNNATVRQVELINSYRGIRAVGAIRHLIRDVTGQPLRVGIYIDQIYDIGRIENVHWNPWWSSSPNMIDFLYRNGEAFVFGRSDWEYVYNTFAFGYRHGYRFIKTADGSCNGNFLGIGADSSWNSATVDACSELGVLVTNGEFVAMPNSASGQTFPDADARQVLVKETNKGVLRFVNSAFWGPSTQVASISGTGTVGFSDCTFQNGSDNAPVIDALSGSILVRGCEFRQSGTPVVVGAGVTAGVVTGNIFHGSGKVINLSTADIQIGLNSTTL